MLTGRDQQAVPSAEPAAPRAPAARRPVSQDSRTHPIPTRPGAKPGENPFPDFIPLPSDFREQPLA